MYSLSSDATVWTSVVLWRKEERIREDVMNYPIHSDGRIMPIRAIRPIILLACRTLASRRDRTHPAALARDWWVPET